MARKKEELPKKHEFSRNEGDRSHDGATLSVVCRSPVGVDRERENLWSSRGTAESENKAFTQAAFVSASGTQRNLRW